MKIRKELWFGFALMAIIIAPVLIFTPWASLSTATSTTTTSAPASANPMRAEVVVVEVPVEQAGPRCVDQHRGDDDRHQRKAEPTAPCGSSFPRSLSARRDGRSPAMSLVLHVHHLLQLVDVDLLHVLHARGPLAGLEADDAADDLGDSLHQHDRAGQRQSSLERIHRRAFGGDVRVLAHRQDSLRSATRPGQGEHAGQEENDVQHEVERGLRARLHASVKHVAAHMAVLGQACRRRPS